jgi:hypothetical protein
MHRPASALFSIPQQGDAPPRLDRSGRVAAAIVACAALGLLLVAAGLSPAGDGAGTHEQLGLPPCAWVVMWNKPCMTCGMTTAFAHAADGHLVTAFLTQPMGCVFAVLTAAMAWIAGYSALTGSYAYRITSGLASGRGLIVLAAALLAAWAYKIVTF